MPIRDILLTAVVLCALPVCLARPWVGILLWSWLSYMNPHRLTWGFAYEFPFGQFVAVVTLIGFALTRDRKAFVFSREMLVLGLLWGWFLLTSLFAMYPEAAWVKFTEFTKILLMAVLVLPLFQDRKRFRILLLVIAGSLGFYGFKGGIFTVLTGGQNMVLGPPGSFFEANTELALVLNMALPILLFLAREEPRRWLKRTLWATFFLCMISVLFTYSRGGVLGLAVVLTVLFASARRRMVIICVGLIALGVFTVVAPERWVNRMQSLENYQEDESANRRFMSWRLGYEIAADRPFMGGGFLAFVHRETYDIYLPEYPANLAHDAHSIYFNLLGEHGWVGLGLFLLLMAVSLLKLRKLRKLSRGHPTVGWAASYAQMLQASLATYLVTGVFISVAYFDLAYQLVILVALLEAIVVAELATAGVPATVVVAAPAEPPMRAT